MIEIRVVFFFFSLMYLPRVNVLKDSGTVWALCLAIISSLRVQTVTMGYALGNMQKFLEWLHGDVLSFRDWIFKPSP